MLLAPRVHNWIKNRLDNFLSPLKREALLARELRRLSHPACRIQRQIRRLASLFSRTAPIFVFACFFYHYFYDSKTFNLTQISFLRFWKHVETKTKHKKKQTNCFYFIFYLKILTVWIFITKITKIKFIKLYFKQMFAGQKEDDEIMSFKMSQLRGNL